ncbi:MAG: cupredoxin domain-containing protein [Actinomycetota bacterium]|nr:cupredoxin domain-containing protein [Actinomycetota bacterium]
MQERPDPNVVREMRIKLPLPVLIPVGALLFIAILTIGLSRILLNVPSDAAVIIALAIALDVLGAAAYLAARPRPSPGTMAELMMVVLFPVVIGIVLTQINFTSAEAKNSSGGPAAVTSSATLIAQNVAFQEKTLTVLGTKGFTVNFDNKDSTTHNFAIYDKKGGKELFKGAVITGPNTTDYQVKPLKAGTYYFQCDIHPTSMNGSLTVK